MLAIECRFLNGTYQAAAPGRVNAPEWPPHPSRLHAAFIAAGWAIGDGTFPPEALAALEWLERAGPPRLDIPDAVGERRSGRSFVPRNLTPNELRDAEWLLARGRSASRQLGRTERTFPVSVPGDRPVRFQWDADPAEHRSVLATLAQEVQYLGSSRSPVCCDIVEDPGGGGDRLTLAPLPPQGARAGERTLRVARNGAAATLLAARHVHPPPVTATLVPYARLTAAEPEPAAASGPFETLVVRAFDRRFPLTILHAPLVARAFREAVLGRAGDDAPAVLHGHGCNPHAAFLPLANVGHPHATGQILGIAIALPAGIADADRHAILHAVTAVNELRNVGLGSAWRMNAADDDGPRTLHPARWTRPARRWQSVTPIILDAHPKGRDDAALERAVRETFANALLPQPEAIELSKHPWQPAAVPAPAYRDRALPGGLRFHASISFAEPVRGPVLAGRGRYFGVGLFAPVHDADVE